VCVVRDNDFLIAYCKVKTPA